VSAMFLTGAQSAPEPDCGLHLLLQQTLPQLTVLTRLVVQEVADAGVFKYAPPQLLELEAVGVDDQSDTSAAIAAAHCAAQICFRKLLGVIMFEASFICSAGRAVAGISRCLPGSQAVTDNSQDTVRLSRSN
jgi:hypothetical protein